MAGIVEQLDEILTRALERKVHEERARAGARLLGPQSRALVEGLFQRQESRAVDNQDTGAVHDRSSTGPR